MRSHSEASDGVISATRAAYGRGSHDYFLMRLSEQKWRDEAECDGADLDLFFPGNGKVGEVQTRQALEMCRRCPVETECLDQAVAEEDGYYIVNGIRGGMTAKQRKNLHHVVIPRTHKKARQSRNQHGSGSSKYHGVTRVPSGRWKARISYRNKEVNLGTFDTEVEAAHVYDDAAINLRGETIGLNFPRKDSA